jgi:hypothetical protein
MRISQVHNFVAVDWLADRPPIAIAAFLIVFVATIWNSTFAAPRADGQLELSIVDAETKEPVAARVHLKSTRGRPVMLRLPGSAEYGDHFYVPGRLSLPLRIGQYTMEIEATPEYRSVASQPFEIERHADDSKEVEIPRFANLADEGWCRWRCGPRVSMWSSIECPRRRPRWPPGAGRRATRPAEPPGRFSQMTRTSFART